MRKLICRIQSKFIRGMQDGDINYDELLQKQKQGAVILDVRSKQEYEENHLNGAISIPQYEINSKVETEISDKNQEIVIYCTSGIRSRKVYEKLKKLGYKNLYNLYLGLDNINYWLNIYLSTILELG